MPAHREADTAKGARERAQPAYGRRLMPPGKNTPEKPKVVIVLAPLAAELRPAAAAAGEHAVLFGSADMGTVAMLATLSCRARGSVQTCSGGTAPTLW
jgi:hypothetical protein